MKNKHIILSLLSCLALCSCGETTSSPIDSSSNELPSSEVNSEISSEQISSCEQLSNEEVSSDDNSLLISSFVREINNVIEIENTDEKVIEMLKTQSEIHKLPEDDRKKISNLDNLHEEMKESEKIIRYKLENDELYNDGRYYTLDIECIVNDIIKMRVSRNMGAVFFEIEDKEYIKSILMCIDKVYIDVEKLDGKNLIYMNGRNEHYDFSIISKSVLYSYMIIVQSNGYVYLYPHDTNNENRTFVSICQIDYEGFSKICNLEILFDKSVNW